MRKPNEYIDEKGNLIKILGMTGMTLSTNTETFFIDSELLVGEDYDIVVFQDRVRYESEDERTLQESKKKEVINIVIEIFKSNNVRPLLL